MERDGAWISVISTGRPGAVGPMTELVGEATWYTGAEDEYDAPAVVRTGGLVEARNRALDDAFALGTVAVQLSDDLVKVERLTQGKRAAAATFAEALSAVRLALRGTPYRLGGVAPTSNPFYGSFRPRFSHFIVGDLIVVRETELRFDPAFRLKEDYDYTCQHIARYGGVLRLDWILCTFRHRSNAGGAVAVRTPELEQEAIARLKAKWPGWIRDNPRRENEVLLRAAV